LSIFAGALVTATVGLLAVGAPAHAHHVDIDVAARCDTATGDWVVTWTIGNSQAVEGRVMAMSSDPAVPVDGIEVGSVLPAEGGGVITATQTLPGDARSTSLSVRIAWTDGFVQAHHRWTGIGLSGGCAVDDHSPDVVFRPNCNGTLVVKVHNTSDGSRAFLVAGELERVLEEPAGPGLRQSVTVASGQVGVVVIPRPYVHQVKVYAGTEESPYAVIAAYGALALCAPVHVATRSTCEAFEVALGNPDDVPYEVRVVSYSREFEETVMLAPGADSVVSLSTVGGIVEVTIRGNVDEDPVRWQEPADCPQATDPAPTTTPAPPALADTGVRLTSVVTLAVALIMVGAGLLVVLRRRRVRTT
jgi:hypothetical protein